MRKYLLNYVKTHSWAYDIYYYIGSFLIRVLGVLTKIDDKSILFVSFGGKKLDDSPKAIYEEMLKQEKFKDFKFYWAFVNPEDFEIPKGEKIKIDTFKYYWVAQKAKFWITNAAIERGLNFKKKSTFYINTWHGTPLKKIGKDENSISEKSGLGSKNIATQDVILAQSEYDAKIFSNIFDLDISKIVMCDLPRNDELTSHTNEKRVHVRKKIGIGDDKKVILYAPTYREYERDEKNNCYLKPPIDFSKWKEVLGENYIVLFRAHYEVVKVLNINESEFLKNVSNYPNLNELMIISDMLVSDYSSIFFDYSILEKPMYCFGYDLEVYSEKRGLYLDLEKALPCKVSKTEEELLNEILNFDYTQGIDKVKQFRKKYAPYAGYATHTVIHLIERRLVK